MDEQAAERKSQDLCNVLEKLVPEVDLVVVADYGHGMIGPAAVDILCKQARCLAVNVQVNAGNHGFNTVSKYPRADFVSLSEKEVRLETRKPTGDLREIVRRVAGDLNCRQMLVTRGARGRSVMAVTRAFSKRPALPYERSTASAPAMRVRDGFDLCGYGGAGPGHWVRRQRRGSKLSESSATSVIIERAPLLQASRRCSSDVSLPYPRSLARRNNASVGPSVISPSAMSCSTVGIGSTLILSIASCLSGRPTVSFSAEIQVKFLSRHPVVECSVPS